MFDAIRYVLTDVDGVLTDGRITIDDHRIETKTFHVLDGSGIVNLRQCGIPTGLITGRQSRALLHWANGFGLSEIHQGVRDKLIVARAIAERQGLALDQVAYIGDDLLDLSLLQAVGFAACPADARPEVQRVVHLVSPVPGGGGVLRDVAERILKAQGRWDDLLRERYGYAPPPSREPR